jgi:hypothetical protein
MRNYKSIGFNYTYILLYLTAIIIIFENNEDFNFFLENKYFFIVFLLITIIISINEIIVDREGIVKKFYLFQLKLKLRRGEKLNFMLKLMKNTVEGMGKLSKNAFGLLTKMTKFA